MATALLRGYTTLYDVTGLIFFDMLKPVAAVAGDLLILHTTAVGNPVEAYCTKGYHEEYSLISENDPELWERLSIQVGNYNQHIFVRKHVGMAEKAWVDIDRSNGNYDSNPVSLCISAWYIPGTDIYIRDRNTTCQNTASNSKVYPSAFVEAINDTVLWFANHPPVTTFTPPGAFTQVYKGGSQAPTSLYYEVVAATGETGTRTATTSAPTTKYKTASISLYSYVAVIPTDPSALTAETISATKIHLTWFTSELNSPTLLHIERSLDGLTGWTVIDTVLLVDQAYDDEGLANDTEYFYRVRAENEIGLSDYSAVASSRTVIPDLWEGTAIVTGESETEVESYLSDTLLIPESQTSSNYVKHTGPYAIDGFNQSGPTIRIPTDFRSLRAGYWLHMTAVDGVARLFTFVSSAGTRFWNLNYDSVKHMFSFSYTGSSEERQSSSDQTAINRNQEWMHIGFALSTNYATLYINGKEVLSTFIPEEIFPPSDYLRVFHAPNPQAFSATIDDIYIDVSAYEEVNHPPPSKRFTAYLPVQPQSITELTVGETRLYEIEPYEQLVGHIPVGIGIYAYAKRNTNGLEAVVEHSGDTEERTFIDNETGYRAFNRFFNRVPDGTDYGEEWDVDKVNSAHIGVKGI